MTKTLRYWQDLIKKSFKIWYLNKILQELNKILILISILQDSYKILQDLKISTWVYMCITNTKLCWFHLIMLLPELKAGAGYSMKMIFILIYYLCVFVLLIGDTLIPVNCSTVTSCLVRLPLMCYKG